ncbi:MAG TPA: hypothetical protein VFT15_18150 [Chitinophagaceae bacterium]|nr:hypothetical protein [Chitinophagaceae bacterium]
MNQKNKNDESKTRNKGKAPDKSKKQSSKHDEDFNTGSHSPSSLRKVGPGYDDTGMGNGSKAPGSVKNVPRSQKKVKGNIQKLRKIISNSGKSR